MTLGPLRFTNALGGTADWIYPGPTTDLQSPASARAVNSTVYLIYAEAFDRSQWEISTGAYTLSSGTFARTTIIANSLGTTAKINFGNPPQVSVYDNGATAAATPIAVIRKQIFTSSGTYTPSANLLYAIIEGLGGGGGGGGAAIGSVTASQYGGGGGGGGGYSRTYASAATIGASQAVTIGAKGTGGAAGANNGTAGGDTSVGSLCIAKGGGAGSFGSLAQFGLGGAGGLVGTGDVAGGGSSGGIGPYSSNSPLSTSYLSSGAGGASVFGAGGGAAVNGSGGGGATNGNAASGYGTGGGGGMAQASGSTGPFTAAGGNGTPGIVVITEYCSA